LKIEISQLSFYTIIGILPFERKHPQPVIVDVSFEYDFKNGEFIDYSKVSAKIEKMMKENKYKLIEDALLDIKQELKKKYKIKKLKLSIKKPNILDNAIVGVSI
jgi:dihydroneopterin aldolase